MLTWANIGRRDPVGLALVGPLAAAAPMIPLRSHVPNTDLALAMVVVVAVVVLPGRRTAALLAGLAAGAWFDFFLTKPYERFTIQRSSDIQTTVLLAAMSYCPWNPKAAVSAPTSCAALPPRCPSPRTADLPP